MPKVEILPGKTAFINGSLYRAGGVAQIEGPKTKDNPNFTELAMRYVSDDTAVSIRGYRRKTVGPTVIAADSVTENPEDTGEGDGYDEELTTAVLSAVGRLDHADDEHWTNSGKPDTGVVTKLAGVKVSRKTLDDLAGDVTRRPAE